MQTKKETIERMLEIFNQAPKGFIFTNNDKVLTHEDIRLRKLFTYKGVPTVSNDEMVFRKFNELRNYIGIERIMKKHEAVLFLQEQGLTKEDIAKTLTRLTSEIIEYNNKPRRTIRNPFA